MVVNNFPKEAFVTLATTIEYAKGAIVLAKALKTYKTTKELVVMVTPELELTKREELEVYFDRIAVVDQIDSGDRVNLQKLGRPELGVTFTKIHCWELTEYTKCVFMDADMLPVDNLDELFSYGSFAACPDIGWPDCFNSGLFVYTPSMATYNDLVAHASSAGSFDGGDQGLLNAYFPTNKVERIPFVYNVQINYNYFHKPAYDFYKESIKAVHFIGSIKPWHQTTRSEYPFVKQWYAICNQANQPNKPDVNMTVCSPGQHENQYDLIQQRIARLAL